MRLDNTNTDNTATSMKRVNRQGGFTLIEVLIALTIFAVGLLAIAAMQTSAIRMNSSAGKLTEISNLGMDTLEQLMSLPYTDPNLDPVNNPFISVANGYTVRYDVRQDFPVTDTKQIILTVTGKGKRLQLITIKALSL
jgi:type IV pilus modification protein PilV